MSKINIVGIGPGNKKDMTIRAYEALKDSDVIVGYTTYIELIRDEFSDKVFLSTPMKREVERCRLCFETALSGEKVSMICSGDAGIYGMAGLMYELLPEYKGVSLNVIPGVTAASSGGAILGSPIGHDFAVISLSDLLTPIELIKKRIVKAAEADLAIVLYNPSSKKRSDYLKKTCELLMDVISPDTPTGYVMNIGREGESFEVCTLKELSEKQVDMFTTVFIGNSNTEIIEGRLVTKRGYNTEK
ncbi:MAG: precorrin-3B C(17)-methyltransferase [Lachnospiraceae bacterium]|nr:precorrin-3B C(17)-methyltransferase [Lachnospiraceae bacterium]